MREEKGHSDFDNIDTLSSDILHKYRTGALSPKQMHRVEQLLLEDPFAAEALEGMDSMENPEKFPEIEIELNQAIKDKVTDNKEKKVVPLYRRNWNIAATILLLIVAGIVIYSTSNNNRIENPIALEKSTPDPIPEDINEDKIADLESDKDANSIQDEENPSANAVNSEPVVVEDKQETAVVKEEETPLLASKPVDIETDEEAMESVLAEVSVDSIEPESGFFDFSRNTNGFTKLSDTVNNSRLKDDIAGSFVDEETAKKAKRSETRSAAPAQAASEEKAAPSRIIAGVVTSAEDGRPLPGVSLSVKGKNVGVITGVNGEYSMAIQPEDSVIIYSFLGYENEEVMVKNTSKADVELETDEMALEEIVITAEYDPFAKDEIIPTLPANPAGGKAAYKSYLKDSLNYPVEAELHRIEGKVKVTFMVAENGALSELQVRRSLGYGCDEEVIRLIKEGPQWNPAKKGDVAVKQKVKVRVKFRLKKE